MKTKNVRVRPQDLKQGVTVFKVHPIYGIEKYLITGRPYMHNDVGLFVPAKQTYDDGFTFEDSFSLHDAGIIDLRARHNPCDSYNGRRTFFKLKHAQEWMEKWSTQRQFKIQHAEHVLRNDEMSELWDAFDYHYDEDDYFDDRS